MTNLKPDNTSRFLNASGKPYHFFADPEISKAQEKREVYLRKFNATTDSIGREKAAKDLFERFGEGSEVVPPIWVEWVCLCLCLSCVLSLASSTLVSMAADGKVDASGGSYEYWETLLHRSKCYFRRYRQR